MSEERKSRHDVRVSKKSRFQIEKLEERIAPAKGGMPGPPDHSNGNGGGHCNPNKERCI